MKLMPLIFILSFFSLVSCQDKSSRKTSNSNQCIGTGYYTIPGCPGYSYYSTTGGTTSGTTSGTTGTNPYTNVSTNPIFQNWGVQYPGGEPPSTCSNTYDPPNLSFPPFETRKATMAIQGKTFYSPASSFANLYENTSPILKSVATAKTLFQTDSLLKIRFKVRPQPDNTANSKYCYIPNYLNMSSIAGYTKLSYNVLVVGQRADGSKSEGTLGSFTTVVNGCSSAIDLSSYASQYPGGLYLVIQGVKGNQGAWPSDYHLYGFKNSSVFQDIRSMDCWLIDIEVAADGTKTFD